VALKQIIAATALACLTLTVVGCGSSSGSSSSTTTTPKQAVCADKDKLQSSVSDLTDPSVLTGGKSSITKALDKVQKNLDALRSSAKSNLQPKVDDVKTAVDQLQTAVQGFGNGSLASNLSKAGDAISKVGTSAGDLVSALNAQCS
jgi:hypothetical protein